MKITRVMIVGTIALVLSFCSTALSGSTVNANPVHKVYSTGTGEKDDLLEALNQSSDEELYVSLHEGKSLYDIASDQGRDIENVIDLQMKQLTQQLDDRLRSGSITTEQYVVYKQELKEIVEQSVFTSFG